MGCNDCCEVFYAENVKKAKLKAQEIIAEDRYENGNDAYSGTIGGCDGLKVHVGAPRPSDIARELLLGSEELRGLCDKWGAAYLMEIAKGGNEPRKRRWMLAAQVAS